MARNDHFLLKSISGQLGKTVVLKQYGKKSVVTKYPDMSKVQASALQIKERNKFAEAVLYARNIINNPTLKALYQSKMPKKATSVYHYAIKEYLKQQQQL